ncbi:MAG: DUF2974 domain-containing protein [Lachnospiraceae bacterium]|nr:DUF2974 domain-containing protein [Lachnospiraceae bacterium]
MSKLFDAANIRKPNIHDIRSVTNNIIHYVREYGDKTCEERPFCEADALVLSQFIYFRWDKNVPCIGPDFAVKDDKADEDGVRLADIYSAVDAEHVYRQELYPVENGQLLEAMAKSKRFGDMICNYYLEDTDVVREMQFAAMYVHMKGALPAILFRGTDGTIVGWKEDFNMAFSRPVAGQLMAAEYVNKIAGRITGDFVTAGHSKGGNLAAFSAMSAHRGIRERIHAIYSFDGPGFRPEILEEYDYASIASRVKKFLPHSSLVGIVLEGCEDYVTVKSIALGGVFQHNPYRWVVDGCDFIREDKISVKSKIIHKSLNEWVMKLDEKQIELLVGTLFGILESTDEEDIPGMLENWKSSLISMKDTALGLDSESRKELRRIIKALLEDIHKAAVEGSKQELYGQ